MPDLPWLHLGLVTLAASAFMALLWVLERRWRDASHVDAGWSAGIGLAGLAYALIGDGDAQRRTLIAALALLWSLRLTLHLVFDRLIGRPEDGRYAMLRRKWQPDDGRWFFVFFQAQAAFVVIFSLPFLVLAADPRPLDLRDAIGATWFVLSFALVVLADRQLAAWRRRPAATGRTCRSGLWAWSRHPNYFFEWTLWWSWVVMASGWSVAITAFVPLFLLFLLLRVTGIPYNEARALESRGDDYRAYQREVSPFIPLPPRSRANAQDTA